jgi:hypothetical protein
MRRLIFAIALSLCWLTGPPDVGAAKRVELLRSVSGLPAHIAGAFLSPIGFQQADEGTYYVFDRRGHAVYTIKDGAEAQKIIEVGQEPGRVLDPTAFDIDPHDGSFVVADAPNGRERLQFFIASGSRLGGFTIPGRELPRLTLDNMVLNGVCSLQYTGRSVMLNQPERGWLVTELALDGTPIRTFGLLRPTGHEAERDLHLAFNVGLPLVDPTGGYYFVFQAAVPLFRKYDARGQLLYERHVEGPEIDDYLRRLPTTWPERRTPTGDLVPLVPPTVRTAGVDYQGNLWISLSVPFTYVYDASGDKIRTVQFRGADLLTPNSLFFTKDGRVLVTPGCYAFKTVPGP